MTNRQQLRITLLISSGMLMLVAIALGTIINWQWSIAPLILSLTTFGFSFGRLTTQSLINFEADLSRLFSHKSEPIQLQMSFEPPKPTTTELALYEEVSVVTTTPITLTLPDRLISKILAGFTALTVAGSLVLFATENYSLNTWYIYALSLITGIGAAAAWDGKLTTVVNALIHRRPLQISALTLVSLSLLVTLGLALRVYELNTWPPGLWYDELELIANADRLSKDMSSIPLFYGFHTASSAYVVLSALQIKMMGISELTGRLITALFGTAGIVAIYLMVRQQLTVPAGLMAAWLLTTMRWDLIWSRIAFSNISLILFTSLAFWLTCRATNQRGVLIYALAGLALGIGVWYYPSARIFPVVLGALLIHQLILNKEYRKEILLGGFVLAIAAVITILPIAQFAFLNPDDFLSRTRDVWIGKHVPEGELISSIRENITVHLMMFHFGGDVNPRHNLPGIPMLDPISGLLMIAGLGISFYRWRTPLLILPIWILVMILPGALTVPWEAPQTLRAMGVIPAVVVLITLPLYYAYVWTKSKKLTNQITIAAITLMLLVIGYNNVNLYFGDQRNNPEVYAGYSTDGALIQKGIEHRMSFGYVPLVSRQHLFEHGASVSAYGGNVPRQLMRIPETAPISSETIWRGAAVFIEPREAGYLDVLRNYYPDAAHEQAFAPNSNLPLFYSIYIDETSIRDAEGLNNLDTGGKVYTTQDYWPTKRPGGINWIGSLHIIEPGEYTLQLQTDAPIEVRLNDRTILSGNSSVVIIPAVGLHKLQVVGALDAMSTHLELLWRKPQNERLEPISAPHLYNIESVGLAGRFYTQSGELVSSYVTPSLGRVFWYDPRAETPYRAVWRGNITLPQSGVYSYRLSNYHGELAVSIDDVEILRSHAQNSAELEMEEGIHSIEIFYETTGNSEFGILWTPPGHPETRLLPEVLTPLPEDTFEVLR